MADIVIGQTRMRVRCTQKFRRGAIPVTKFLADGQLLIEVYERFGSEPSVHPAGCRAVTSRTKSGAVIVQILEPALDTSCA